LGGRRFRPHPPPTPVFWARRTQTIARHREANCGRDANPIANQCTRRPQDDGAEAIAKCLDRRRALWVFVWVFAGEGHFHESHQWGRADDISADTSLNVSECLRWRSGGLSTERANDELFHAPVNTSFSRWKSASNFSVVAMREITRA
jgi:hypothetical protein